MVWNGLVESWKETGSSEKIQPIKSLPIGFRSFPKMFIPPSKKILTKEQLDAFQSSDTCKDVVTYIQALNETVVGQKLSENIAQSAVRVHRNWPYTI